MSRVPHIKHILIYLILKGSFMCESIKQQVPILPLIMRFLSIKKTDEQHFFKSDKIRLFEIHTHYTEKYCSPV